MKAQELRIGNYVLDSGGKVLRIDLFEHLQSGYDCKFGQRMFIDGDEVHPLTEYTDRAKPISLTDQWLIDFGFAPSYFESGELAFWRIDGRDFLNKNMEIRWFNTKIGHVHQLQNLYFALTGEELQL